MVASVCEYGCSGQALLEPVRCDNAAVGDRAKSLSNALCSDLVMRQCS